MKGTIVAALAAILALQCAASCSTIAEAVYSKRANDIINEKFKAVTGDEKKAVAARCDSLAAIGQIAPGSSKANIRAAWGKPDFKMSGKLRKTGGRRVHMWWYVNRNTIVVLLDGKMVRRTKMNPDYGYFEE